MRKFFAFKTAVVSCMLSSSCATICGGSKYHAHVLVNGRPNAEIVHDGIIRGNGTATISIKRNLANKFALTIREKGCEEQKFNYHTRTFRGWAFLGTLVTWTGNVGGVFIPWGLAVDLATGALWKPNEAEGIVKNNYKNFQYIVNYTGCQEKKEEVNDSDMLVDVVYLKNGSMIKGAIIEQDPTHHVKIQTKDGSIFVFNISEIEKITRE
jgi:hypothetical protein